MVAELSPKLGFWVETPGIAACEIAALVGYDIAIVDMEHGSLGTEACEAVIAHGRLNGLTVYVRVAAAERRLIQQALDFGADGVMLPQITGAAHAQEVCAYAKYPPIGTRGVGYSRTMSYGVGKAIDDAFFAGENSRTVCHPMIETPGALAEVEAILALDTVDGVFIGPSDLSMTSGRGTFRFTEADAADFRIVAAAARKAGKAFALPAPANAAFDLAVAEKADYVTVCDNLTALQTGFAQGLAVAQRARKVR